MELKLKCDWAYLDVKYGRQELKKRVEAGEKFPVTITGVISCVHSEDDGVSRMFQVDVSNVETPTLK